MIGQPPTNIGELEQRARRRLPRMVYDFIAGGAEDEVTLRANRTAFARPQLRPRAFVGVAQRDASVEVLGAALSMPLVLGPAGLAGLVHRDAELALARAAGAAGLPICLSIASSYSIEEVARVACGPLWFQLYIWRDLDLVERIVRRAQRAGYSVLVLTMDVPLVGRRERDLRNGFSAPPRLTPLNLLDIARRTRWLQEYVKGREITFQNLVGETDPSASGSAGAMADYINSHLAAPGVTWETVEWLRGLWPGRLVAKGLLTAEDALKAQAAGLDGVIVSNHGGRQLDGVPATLELLPGIAAAVGERMAVLIDGGVRRGTDILKALALGADACLVARPWWWGLATGGESGVRQMIEMFRNELDIAQGLVGVPSLAAASRREREAMIFDQPMPVPFGPWYGAIVGDAHGVD
jgi:L-lactate dehydrogenase (cytochrome)